MKNLFPPVLMAMLLLATGKSFSQGCVAIRSTGATCALHIPDSVAMLSKWQLGLNYRYFKSYKHFVGKEEQKQRVDSGSNVINHSNTIDIAITHQLNSRWTLLLDVPVVAYSRSSIV
jgi:hypothetical protein